MDSISINKIFVHIYGYKQTELIDVVDNLILQANSVDVDIYIDDQNNLTRYEKFIKYKNVFYNPVWWDELISPWFYRKQCVENQKLKDYTHFLFISKPYQLTKDWDQVLINLLPENGVLSGHKIKSIKNKNLFYIDKEYDNSDTVSETGYIDHSFIFGKTEDLYKIDLPDKLKYYGIDEYLSILFLNINKNIYSVPSYVYKLEPDNLLIKDYVPFSLEHNYNDVLNLLINNKTNILKYIDPSKFINKNNINILNLHQLPFDFNDIEYSRFSELDNIGGKRYIEKRDTVA